MKDEVDFLPADKSQMFPQIDTILLYYYYTITLGVWGKACTSYPKNKRTILHNVFTISQKEDRDEVVICM